VPTKDIDKAGFFETVAVNRGVKIKAFADFEQAIAWLVMHAYMISSSSWFSPCLR
jgi:hypothetical protein